MCMFRIMLGLLYFCKGLLFGTISDFQIYQIRDPL